MAQSRINIEEENRKLAQSKRSIASDSLQKFQLQVLDLDNNNEVAGELGPLQYLSNLTGTSMDKIINWLLLIIIFVFDPLAISLVVAANFAFDKAYPKKQYRENLYGEEVEVLSPRDISKIVKENENSSPPNEDLTKAAMEFEVKDAEEMQTQEEFLENLNKLEKIKDWEAAERRMEIIGQNGNNGEHYEDIPKELSWLDLDGDGFISQVELKDAYKNISKLEKILKSDISKDKQKYILNLINEIKKRIKSDDTKTY
jgi:Ca2+-binding EF-hand superfamily protein